MRVARDSSNEEAVLELQYDNIHSREGVPEQIIIERKNVLGEVIFILRLRNI